MPALERMAAIGMPLLIHGEVTDPEIDIFDREAVFIEQVLDPLRRRVPELRIVLEHVTTEEAVAYVAAGGPNIAATITAHHLVISRNAIFAGGIRPQARRLTSPRTPFENAGTLPSSFWSPVPHRAGEVGPS